MLTVELKNNGRLLAHLTATPKGSINGEKEYHYEYYKVGKKDKKGIAFVPKSNKLEQLAATIMSDNIMDS